MKKFAPAIMMIVGIIAVGYFLAYKMFHVPGREEALILFTAWIIYPVLLNPIVGIYAVFIVSPFIPLLRRLYYLTYDRPKVDLLIMTSDLLMVLVLIGLFFDFGRRRAELVKVRFWFRFTIWYFLYMLFRTFVINELAPAEAVTIFKNYGPPVFFFLLGMMYANQHEHIKRLWNITIVIGVIAVVYGIKQLYVGYARYEDLWFSSIQFSTLFINGKARPFSIFQAPVAFADYMQLAMTAALMAVSDTGNRLKIVFILLVPLFFYGSLITSVRSNWAGLIMLIILWFTIFGVKGTYRRTIVMTLLILSFVIYNYANNVLDGSLGIDRAISATSKAGPDSEYMEMLVTNRTSALTDPFEEHSLQSRMDLWRSLIITSFHPLYFFTGHGLGKIKADSVYFDYLGQYGWPGVIFIIWLIVVFIRKGFFVIDNSRDPQQVLQARAITATTIVFAVVSVTGTHIHGFPGDVYFWFFNGVLIKQAAEIKADASVTASDEELPA